MQDPTFDTVAAAAEHLTIIAFDRFRDAAGAADLPLPAINAFAAYKSAVDFVLEAAAAVSRGDRDGEERFLGWSRAMLADMNVELSKLSAGEQQ